MNFEQALTKLEKITQQLHHQQLPLEKALAAYAEGCELVQFCQHTLQQAEQKIQLWEDNQLKEYVADE